MVTFVLLIGCYKRIDESKHVFIVGGVGFWKGEMGWCGEGD